MGHAHCLPASKPTEMHIHTMYGRDKYQCKKNIKLNTTPVIFDTIMVRCLNSIVTLVLSCQLHLINSHGIDKFFVLTLLSSMTVLRDSIHIGSMSPSSTIHLGLSVEILDISRMIHENKPLENYHAQRE